MKKYMKPAVLIPIITGAAAGILMFIAGDADDAPGLSLIGLATAFLLIMWGLYNAEAIRKGLFAPILLFCFGMGGILVSIVLLLDGEFEESPGMALIGIALGVVLIAIGVLRLRKARTK